MNNTLAKLRGTDILRDINVIMDHEIFNNDKDFVYYMHFMQNPHTIRIEVDRSKVEKSNVIFEFDGSKRVVVCTNFAGSTYESFNYPLYREGSINKTDTAKSFDTFIMWYLTNVACKENAKI